MLSFYPYSSFLMHVVFGPYFVAQDVQFVRLAHETLPCDCVMHRC